MKLSKSFSKDNLLLWSVVLFIISIIIRLIFLLQFKNSLLFDNHIVDMLYHHEWAKAISEGREYYSGPFFRAPLYPVLLGLFYSIFGIGDWVIRIFQIVLGSSSTVLVFLIGYRTFNFKRGLLAGLLMSVCGSLIFFEGHLLGTTLAIFLNLLSIYYLIKAIDEPKLFNFFLAGIFMGLSAITRPNILFFAALVLIWMFWQNWRKIKIAFRNIILIVIGLIIPILPVTIYNYEKSNEFIPIAAYGGINFYIANYSQADGVSPVLPGIRQDWWGGKEDTKRIAETESQQKLSEADQSRFWFDKAKKEINESPIRFFKLILRKVILLINGYELSNNFDFYFFAYENPILNTLIYRGFIFIPFGLIFSLAVVGFISSYPYTPKSKILLLFSIGYSISIILFLISARYRLPLMPILILFASAGIFGVIDFFKTHKYEKVMVTIIAFLIALCLSNYDYYGYHQLTFAQGYHTNATLYAKHGDMVKAEENYRKAIEENPYLAASINDLSLILIGRGETDEAVTFLERGVLANPDNPMLKYNLGYAYLENGQPKSAIDPLNDFVRLMPDNLYGLNNLGLAYMKSDFYDSANYFFSKAVEINSDFIPAYYNLAVTYEMSDMNSMAIIQYRRILQIFPEELDALYNIGLNWLALEKPDSAFNYFDKYENLPNADSLKIQNIDQLEKTLKP